MSDTTIAITKREAASTRANKRLRKQDVIPGVLYGQGREPMPIQVERVILRNAFSVATRSSRSSLTARRSRSTRSSRRWRSTACAIASRTST
jgi:ribosomal protein L25 (general stress protein Ctc)